MDELPFDNLKEQWSWLDTEDENIASDTIDKHLDIAALNTPDPLDDTAPQHLYV